MFYLTLSVLIFRMSVLNFKTELSKRTKSGQLLVLKHAQEQKQVTGLYITVSSRIAFLHSLFCCWCQFCHHSLLLMITYVISEFLLFQGQLKRCLHCN